MANENEIMTNEVANEVANEVVETAKDSSGYGAVAAVLGIGALAGIGISFAARKVKALYDKKHPDHKGFFKKHKKAPKGDVVYDESEDIEKNYKID